MIEELRELEKLGYVRSVEHKDYPLLVWNYTPVVQYESLFGDYPLLRRCRGLVTDREGNIVSNCLQKFFNYEELAVSERPYKLDKIEVTEKLDGSMFVVSKYKGNLVFNTRGSFYSEQCYAAQKLFYELYDAEWIEDGVTYLFEYIGPENRIVVSYETSDLIHIARLETLTGRDLARDERFKCVKVYDINGGFYGDNLYELLLGFEQNNKEGFVITQLLDGYVQNFRMKIKFESYKQLHKIVTGLSSKNIWEMLRDGQNFDSILEICPDEFNDWLRNVKADLLLKYQDIEAHSIYVFESVKPLKTRKEQANKIIKDYKDVASVVFLMLDNQDYSSTIWKMVKPTKFDQPFQNQGEDSFR